MSDWTLFILFVLGVPASLYGGAWLLTEWQAWRERRRRPRLTWRNR